MRQLPDASARTVRTFCFIRSQPVRVSAITFMHVSDVWRISNKRFSSLCVRTASGVQDAVKTGIWKKRKQTLTHTEAKELRTKNKRLHEMWSNTHTHAQFNRGKIELENSQ